MSKAEQASDSPRGIPLNQMIRDHPGRWIVTQITEEDCRTPLLTKGIVIFTGPEKEAKNALNLARRTNPKSTLAFFYVPPQS